MIKYIQGNLLDALKDNEIQAIAHGCNCTDGFGSGIAKQIARRYPHVKNAYHEYVSVHNAFLSPKQLLGKCLYVATTDGLIVNMFTQENYGTDGKVYCSYEAIETGFSKLKEICKDSTIGIPKIGAGLGGGEWNIIEAIINKVFDGREIFVYLLPEKK